MIFLISVLTIVNLLKPFITGLEMVDAEPDEKAKKHSLRVSTLTS